MLGECASAQLIRLPIPGQQRQALPPMPPLRQGPPTAPRTEYASPDTPLAVDDGPRRFVPAIYLAGVPRTFDDTKLQLGLATTRVETETVGARQPVQQIKVLECSYKPVQDGGSSFSPRVRVWLNNRPDLTDLPAAHLEQLRFKMVDVGLNRCPQTWGEALKLGWGDTAWADLQAHANRQLAEREDTKRRWEEQQAAKARQRHEDWVATALRNGPLPPADEQALLKAVEAEVSGFEMAGASLQFPAFRRKVEGPLCDSIDRLAQSAWVRGNALSASGAGRAAYDRWDQTLGGRVVHAVHRLGLVRYAQEHRRLSLAEVKNINDRTYQEGLWSNGADLNPILQAQIELVDLMQQKLKGQDLIPARFLQRASKQLARERPRGDPGRALYIYQPSEKKPSWSLTPEEQAAQESAVGKAMDLVALVGSMMAILDKLDADAISSRIRLWQCVASDCDDAGTVLYAYSYAQTAKDHHFFLSHLNPAVRALAPGMSALGDSNIDGGLIWGCRGEQVAFETAISDHLKQRPNTSIAPVLDGPAYRNWQTCRDRMEFFLRPRTP